MAEQAITPAGLNFHEAAAYLGVSTMTVRRMVKRGELQPARFGRRVVFPRGALQLIARATEQLAAATLNLTSELGKSIERLNHLYMEAVKVQDHKTALSVQKEINRMLKLSADAAELEQPARTVAQRAQHPLRIVR